MDYRTWLQQRKRQNDSREDTEDGLGSKFEITRKTNSTILEESSKAEDDDESILETKPHHRPTNSKKINPMLLLTNTDQTMQIKSGLRDYALEKDAISGEY